MEQLKNIVIDRKFANEFEIHLVNKGVFEFGIANNHDLYFNPLTTNMIVYEFAPGPDFDMAIQIKKDMGYWYQ